MAELNLPKEYFSYSQLRTWLDNKEQYRDRYYRGIESPGSKYLLFGSEIAKGLEDGTIKVPGLILYPVKEEQIKLEVDGVPFHGYLDQFWPERFKFRETKTGVRKPGGAPRWTQRDVDRHIQLDIYSMLIQLKYGSVDDECHLDWLHTKQKKSYIEFAGHQLEADSQEMELTGEVTSFTRVITQNDRDRMRFLIRSAALEISKDFTQWLETNQRPVFKPSSR